jgi:hypothetical protein
MAKNIKWMKVDSVTGVSHMVALSQNGLTDPNLSGLTDGNFDWNDFEYGTCDDSVTADPSNFIIELTDEQWISDIQEKANYQLGNWKAEIYKAEKDLRNEQLGTYGESVYAAGAGYKYDAAVEFLNNGTANAGLTTEANIRGISVTALATKIKNNHEDFITKDAKIAGLRGMMYDRINAVAINTTSVTTALNSYAGIHTDEIIGTDPTGIGASTVEIRASYYQSYGFADRYRFL